MTEPRRCVWCGLGDIAVGAREARRLVDEMSAKIRPDECVVHPFFYHMVTARTQQSTRHSPASGHTAQWP